MFLHQHGNTVAAARQDNVGAPRHYLKSHGANKRNLMQDCSFHGFALRSSQALWRLRGRFACQSEEELGAFVGLALRPDAATMLINDSLNSGQSDAAAGELILPVHSVEGTEQSVGVFHIEARAVVLYKEGWGSSPIVILPTSILASGRLDVNFHALPNRFANAPRSNTRSP